MNKIDLEGKHAVVTGGAQGLGFAMAKRIVDSGARVTLWDLDESVLEKALNELGEAAMGVSVDVADSAAIDAARDWTLQECGPVSIVVNSAGIAGPNASVDEYDIGWWKKIIDINLTGTFLVCRAFIPGMKESNYGRIVNISSVAGKEGNPTMAAYSASKAGVMALTKSLGKEVAGYDIAVNCITPATAETRILEPLKPEMIEYMRSRIPRGRFLKVDEAASMVAWLVSAENSFTTGATFDLSGGRTTY